MKMKDSSKHLVNELLLIAMSNAFGVAPERTRALFIMSGSLDATVEALIAQNAQNEEDGINFMSDCPLR